MTQVLQENSETLALACLEVWGGNEPVDTALRVPGLEVWVYGVPFGNAAAGGDVHFVSSCGTGRIARLMVADVSGHGAEVAETARDLRGLIRRFMNHIDQRRFVQAMNAEFGNLVKVGRFATAVVMTYFAPNSELDLCNAGHPPPLVFSKKSGKWRYLESEVPEDGNVPLGIVEDVAYEQFQVTLEAGDLVLCYTDSLIEAECRDGTLLGAERLLEMVQSVPVEEAGHLTHHLLAKMAVHGAVLNDDVTVLLMRSTGRHGGAGFLARLWAQIKFLGQVVTFRKDLPWPEWSRRNIGGAVGLGNK